MAEDINKRVEAFEAALDLLEQQVDWQKDHFQELFEADEKKNTEIHIKYAELSSVVELIKEQLKWQKDFVNNFVRQDTSLDKKMADRVNEMSRLVGLMADKLDLQKDKLDSYIKTGATKNNSMTDRLGGLKDDITKLKSVKDIDAKREINDVKGSVRKMKNVNKFHGDYIKKLERKIENKQNAIKKRFKQIENKIDESN
jgi:Ni,Fe-hydrogenase I large subunit